MRSWQTFLLAVSLALLAGCKPEIDVYAVEKELYVVYGMLNPDADTQYVSIKDVWQTSSDAYVYAAGNDGSARHLRVSLDGAGEHWEAILVDSIDRGTEGDFPSIHAAFAFETGPGKRLQPGERYDLSITRPDDSDFLITSSTVIPTRPHLITPGGPLYSPNTNTYVYNTYDFIEDVGVLFEKGTGHGFEIRVYLNYWDGMQHKTVFWGPTRIFRENYNCRAQEALGRMCYQIPARIVARGLKHEVAGSPGPIALYDTVRVAHSEAALSKHVWLELTAVDSVMTSYLHSNTPFGFGLNLLMDKPDVSNISGDNVGIFGSYITTKRYFNLGSCTRYLAGFGNDPGGCD